MKEKHWYPTKAQLRCLKYAIESYDSVEAKRFILQGLYDEISALVPKTEKLVVTLDYIMDECLFRLLSFSNRGYIYMDIEEVKNLCRDTIENIYNERERAVRFNHEENDYPPPCYYTMLDYAMSALNGELKKWDSMELEERSELLDKSKEWFLSKIDEIREPNERELNFLDKSGRCYAELTEADGEIVQKNKN